MPITTCMTDKYREELFSVGHNLTTDQIRVGLFDAAAGVAGTYDQNTEGYAELTGDENAAAGYTAKGEVLTSVSPTHDGTNHVAYWDFSNDVTWASITMTASGAFIINDTNANDRVISLHDFGGDKTASGGDFVIQAPAAAYNTAILRFA